ncbi:hypothetical protein [Sphaerisporangium sp. TRM90804]|uniref:hypothetical protein n=1 Tax=Sphaerisporangium sp. TRM90804 TaxID=3031113 RepID=UPI00244D02A7|nr:hypothetical protein [Sphaerisporangium sp. TRM90804]MDH2423831.1 hypothetical protein [Sphaerisporangium sp. TRM90804]
MRETNGSSARERQRIVDEFVDRAFAGIDPDAPGAHIANGMRQLPPDAPDVLGPERQAAWEELAALMGDESFQRGVRQMAVTGARGGEPPAEFDAERVGEHAGAAVAAGVAPDSARGQEILGRILAPGTTAERRARLAERVATFTDRRVERYWLLMGVLNDRPPFPESAPAYEWFAAALRA